jgi:hypothetical protein
MCKARISFLVPAVILSGLVAAFAAPPIRSAPSRLYNSEQLDALKPSQWIEVSRAPASKDGYDRRCPGNRRESPLAADFFDQAAAVALCHVRMASAARQQWRRVS